MHTFTELLKEINNLTTQYPELREEMLDFYELAINEVAEGGSKQHEINLALNSIHEITKNK
jgi:hypothetical protein